MKPHKISTHLAYSENSYFIFFYRLSDWVEILQGFTKFNSCFYNISDDQWLYSGASAWTYVNVGDVSIQCLSIQAYMSPRFHVPDTHLNNRKFSFLLSCFDWSRFFALSFGEYKNMIVGFTVKKRVSTKTHNFFYVSFIYQPEGLKHISLNGSVWLFHKDSLLKKRILLQKSL